MVKDFLRTGVVASALSALLILSACTWTVQPEGSVSGSDAPSGGASSRDASQRDVSEMAIAEWVLPDGTSCFFSGSGLTIEFDDKHANYTCEPVDATLSESETQVILNDPVIAGPTEYLVDFATVALTDGGYELHSSEAITYTAWQIVLEDGRVCRHAGFGATMGFDGNRLNYTCDKGDSSADEVGLMGTLTNAGEGVWLAQIDEIGRDDGEFVQLSSSMVPVAVVSGVDVQPGISTPTPPVTEVRDALLDTTWQWVETVYSNGTVLVADDPSRYTLTFGADGMVDVRFDCNRGGGPYTVDESSLIFGALVTTLMGCPDGSQAHDFASDLADVYSYVIEDGHLYLSLQLDSGIIELAPSDEELGEATVEATVEATEEATGDMEEGDTTPTPEATEEVTEEAPEEATAEAGEEADAETDEAAASNELAGTTWQWEQSVYEGDMVLAINEPSRYMITFNADGTLAAQLDCNSGRGSYTVDGSSLTFGPITSTRMACPPDSQDAAFMTDLAAVSSYVMADGNLHLTLTTDGVMEFSLVE